MKRIRKKLRANLNASKMADTNRTLNQSIVEFGGGGVGTYGFETTRTNNNSGELMLKEERHPRTSAKTEASSGVEIELAGLHQSTDRDVDVSVTTNNSVNSSPRSILTSNGLIT